MIAKIDCCTLCRGLILDGRCAIEIEVVVVEPDDPATWRGPWPRRPGRVTVECQDCAAKLGTFSLTAMHAREYERAWTFETELDNNRLPSDRPPSSWARVAVRWSAKHARGAAS